MLRTRGGPRLAISRDQRHRVTIQAVSAETGASQRCCVSCEKLETFKRGRKVVFFIYLFKKTFFNITEEFAMKNPIKVRIFCENNLEFYRVDFLHF